MQLSNLGRPEEQPQYYYEAAPQNSKKKILMIGWGIAVLFIALILVLTSGNAKPGQTTMKNALQNTSEALAIIDTYEEKIKYTPTKNDVALTQILLRGNFQKLNILYNKTYNPRKKFSSSPLIDSSSKLTLDQSSRNNTLDSDIITALEPKIKAAETSLVKTSKSFTKPSSKQSIQDSITDLKSVEDLLNRSR